jgi:4-carboxymuconolactone decarboxylase
MSHVERMPPLEPAAMNEAQRKAAQALTAGPRGGNKREMRGPFIALLRSPELMDRLQQVGEYLRFRSSLEPRLSEFLMLIVSRRWTQQFEWSVHVPLALKAGVTPQTIETLAAGSRPAAMAANEALAYDFCDELLRNNGVSDATYRGAVERFGEAAVIDMLGVIGYFTTVSMVLNVAHTPPIKDEKVSALRAFPL